MRVYYHVIREFLDGFQHRIWKYVSPSAHHTLHNLTNTPVTTVYMGGRFMLGFGNSLSQMSSPLLLTEICHPQHRGPVTAVYNCLWNAGALLVTLMAIGTANIASEWSWRSITLMQLVPSSIQLAGVWFVPESPRYLINKDRHQEALHILAKWHAGGDVNNATVQFEFREIKETIRIQKDMDRSTKYRDFVATRGNRWRLAIIVSLGIISQYSGNALFSNYMNSVYVNSGISDEDENRKLGISAGKILLDLIVTVAAALNVDRFGRRPLFLISTFGMVGSFACWTVTAAMYERSGESNAGLGYAQLVFIWVFGIFYDIGFSGLLVAYALEVLPFHLRAKGMMIMNITVQAALALGKYVVPVLSHLPFLLEPSTSAANMSSPAKQTNLPGKASPTSGTLCCSTRYGTSSSWCLSGSSTSRQRVLRWKKSHASSTATRRLPTLIWSRCRGIFALGGRMMG